jgi:hypothetical protein
MGDFDRMGKAKRGRVSIPLGSRAMNMDAADLGLLVLLHGAVMKHGDRETGQLPNEYVRELAVKHGAELALDALDELGVVDVGEVFTTVTTWLRYQGKAENERRAKARARVARHRASKCNALHASKGPEAQALSPSDCNALHDSTKSKCNALHEDNSPETAGESAEPCNALQPKVQQYDPDLSSSSLPDPDLSSLPSEQITDGGSESPAFPGQQGLFGGAAPAEVRQVLREWSELEPLRHLPDAEAQVTAWVRAFPDVDLCSTGYQVAAWWQANPKLRASRLKRLPQFVHSWLSREQDKITKRRDEAQANGKKTPSTDEVWI